MGVGSPEDTFSYTIIKILQAAAEIAPDSTSDFKTKTNAKMFLEEVKVA